MSKDLLDAVSDVAREESQPPDDPRWEALSRGELSAAEVQALERQAATDPEIAQRLELFRPISAERRAEIAQRVLPAPVAEPISIRRRAAWTLIPVAMAAALMIWLIQPARISPLPAYEAVAEGGQAELRSAPAPAGPVILAPSSTLTLVLRPATDVEGPVAVRFYAVQDQRFEALELEPERAAPGSLRVRAKASDLFGARRGNWRLIALVGRPPALQVGLDGKVRGAADRGQGWQRVSVDVSLIDEP